MKSIDLEVLDKLAKALDVHPAVLIDRTDDRGGATVKREAVSEQRLVELLNKELAKHGPYTVEGSIVPLRRPDATGSNWSDVRLRRTKEGDKPPRGVLTQAVGKIRRRYNLAD